MLSALIVLACAVVLMQRARPKLRVAVAARHEGVLGQAQRLLREERPVAALEVLDHLDPRELGRRLLAHWLNVRANALALLGRSTEALEHLDDLQAILAEDDVEDESLHLCAVGNRGVALLYAGRVDEAERYVNETAALATKLAARAPAFAAVCTAECWWWHAEIAARRGQTERRRQCLERVAECADSEFAARARLALSLF